MKHQFSQKTFHKSKQKNNQQNIQYATININTPTNYVFPRNSFDSKDISKQVTELEGIIQYKLGSQNRNPCKLALTPIKIQRSPILGLDRIRQISIQKGYKNNENRPKDVKANQQKKDIHILGNYYMNNGHISKLRQKKVRSLSCKSMKLKSPLDKHSFINLTHIETNKNAYRQNSNSIHNEQVAKRGLKKQKLQVMGSSGSLRRIQPFDSQGKGLQNSNSPKHPFKNNRQIISNNSSHSPIHDFVEQELQINQTINANLRNSLTKYEYEGNQQNQNVPQIPINSYGQVLKVENYVSLKEKSQNIKKIKISLKRK